MPHVAHGGPRGGEHAVLQAVEAAAVDGGHEFPREEAEEDAWGEVVLSYAVGHLEVLVEYCWGG